MVFRLNLDRDELDRKHKRCCVLTFYSAFRQVSLGGNLRAYGDAKVCEI